MVKTWIKSLENSRSIRCLELYLNGIKLQVAKLLGGNQYQNKTSRNLASPHEHFEKFAIDATNKGTTKINLPLHTEIIAEK